MDAQLITKSNLTWNSDVSKRMMLVMPLALIATTYAAFNIFNTWWGYPFGYLMVSCFIGFSGAWHFQFICWVGFVKYWTFSMKGSLVS
jgi:hypothetical protein